MSLIVARKVKNNLIILSDTKLTPHNDERANNRPSDGTIKSYILSKQISVSFAGSQYFAEAALKKIGNSLDVEFIKDVLLETHKESCKETDFILALDFEYPSLFVIKDFRIEETENSWIGSQSGFNQYQGYLSIQLIENEINELLYLKIVRSPDSGGEECQRLYRKMFDAMVGVIDGSESVPRRHAVIPNSIPCCF